MAVIDQHPSRSFSAPLMGGMSARDASLSAKASLPWPVVVYLICVVIPIGFQVGPLAMTTLRLFLILMIIPLMVQLLSGRFGKVLFTDILFMAHIGWALVALAKNNPSQVVQQVGSVGVEFLGGYVLARAYVRTPEVFVALCRYLVVLVLMMTPLALYETFTGDPFLIRWIEQIPGIQAVAIVTIDGRMGLERVQATFAHPIHFGLFCSVAFSLGFVALKGLTPTPLRWFSSVVVAGLGFTALSSGALLAMVLQFGLIIWSSIFAAVRHRWRLLLALAAVAYVVVDVLSNRTPLQVFMSYATFSAHNAYWRGIIFEWGMKNVWANPIFGLGLRDWVRPWYMRSGSMDNFWLVMAVRYGIPGFLLIAIGYALGVFQVMRRNFDSDARLTLIRRAWVFTFLGLSFTLCTVHVWTNVYSFVFFMFGAGMWLIREELSPEDAQASESGPQARRVGPALRRSGLAATPHPRANPVPPPRAQSGYTRFAVRPAARGQPNGNDPSEHS